MTRLDEEQQRLAEAVRAGNNAAFMDTVGTYLIWRPIFAVTTPTALISALIIGIHTNGYVGWGSLILQQVLAVTYSKTMLLFLVLMVLLAGGFAVGN